VATKQVVNTLITFFIIGLWHGANWTFVLWGLTHGLVYILESLLTRILKLKKTENNTLQQLTTIFKTIKTFVIVTFIWVLFRASNLGQVKAIFSSLANNFSKQDNFNVEPKIWLFLLLFIVLDILLFNKRFDRWCGTQKAVIRWSFYTIFVFLIIVFSSVNNFPFIYFQF
jgi:D-alanyl-lipoteichoic acid acyltransferase DltB (MBOAT superfamily)